MHPKEHGGYFVLRNSEKMINALYKYPEPNNKRLFKLVEIRTCVYIFECGHWVTNLVFKDMILVSSQLQLF